MGTHVFSAGAGGGSYDGLASKVNRNTSSRSMLRKPCMQIRWQTIFLTCKLSVDFNRTIQSLRFTIRSKYVTQQASAAPVL